MLHFLIAEHPHLSAFHFHQHQFSAEFINRGTATGHSFAGKLTGTAGNPDAIGAHLTVHFKDGTAQAAELAAGSGHLSQSEPLAFFGYATGNEPVTIDVTWPDGKQTTHPFKAGTPKLELRE